MVKEKVTEQVKKEVPAQVRDQVPVYLAEGLILERKTTKEETERLISKAILQERGRMQAHISSQIQNAIDNGIPSLLMHLYTQLYVEIWTILDDAPPKGENIAKWQKTSEYKVYVSGESSSGQVNKEERGPSTSAKLKTMADGMAKTKIKDFLSLQSTKIHTISSKLSKEILMIKLSLINQDLLYLRKEIQVEEDRVEDKLDSISSCDDLSTKDDRKRKTEKERTGRQKEKEKGRGSVFKISQERSSLYKT
ncbi:hypothetical protein Tco_1044163 [Tanacetum coccineum]|uniref:Uncharacterized protein n=1 Tax=Tanacetum coccineum TaxID=301880 RepID=A0ABQ5GRQ1_9ASTR